MKKLKHDSSLSDKLDWVVEILLEELEQVLLVLDRLEHDQRHKESARERVVLIGQGDHHEVATWPYMQVIGREEILVLRSRRYLQFQVVAGDVALREVDRLVFEQAGAHSRVGSVAAHYQIGLDVHRLFSHETDVLEVQN